MNRGLSLPFTTFSSLLVGFWHRSLLVYSKMRRTRQKSARIEIKLRIRQALFQAILHTNCLLIRHQQNDQSSVLSPVSWYASFKFDRLQLDTRLTKYPAFLPLCWCLFLMVNFSTTLILTLFHPIWSLAVLLWQLEFLPWSVPFASMVFEIELSSWSFHLESSQT